MQRERLIEPDNNETVVEKSPGEVTEPVSIPHETVRRSPVGRARGIFLILLAVVLVVLIVLFARWLYHVTHNNTEPVNVSTQKTSPQATSSLKAESGKGSQSVSSGSSSSSSSSRTSASSSNKSKSSTTQTKPTTPNNGLPNSGPGDVIAIFAGTSLAVAGIHYLVQNRRARNVKY